MPDDILESCSTSGLQGSMISTTKMIPVVTFLVHKIEIDGLGKLTQNLHIVICGVKAVEKAK